MKLLFAAVCGLLLLLNAAHVESRRHRDSDSGRRYKLFVFGDEFADAGNFPLADLTKTTRAWYYPYGSNDKEHGATPSGRFSNGLVLSDFFARILGRKESPPAESKRKQDGVDPSGMNFAVGGAGVVEGTSDAPRLGRQVDKFKRLVRLGIIDEDLTDSVALIAFSGRRDYERFNDMTSTEVKAKAQEVTDKIADAVDQLMDLGVEKVVVTSLPPLGCTPWLSRSEDGVYDAKCDSQKVASIHNSYLEEKVFQDEAVFNLDLKAAFSHYAGPSPRSKQFKYRLESCCESFDRSGFCGQVQDGEPQYSLGSKPDKFFYWDDINPTHAGWKAVVKEFEESIKNYLNI
ncbi:hypothetical protein SEVIR_2G375400v4 [Setaria viridis]|uniref:SGNH hydrolase-type esterase domain-containing protein n=2 Tax=Setaria viridis TaxID=4556 RepID=A0A4U6W4A5_SETVI|nr:GDSL esterase/lipase At5g03600-like [Setaria viridis]TKW35479.1 hypothetical protein SEVIR_2G375400v2 [Setaria viridis]